MSLCEKIEYELFSGVEVAEILFSFAVTFFCDGSLHFIIDSHQASTGHLSLRIGNVRASKQGLHNGRSLGEFTL